MGSETLWTVAVLAGPVFSLHEQTISSTGAVCAELWRKLARQGGSPARRRVASGRRPDRGDVDWMLRSDGAPRVLGTGV